MERVGQPTQHRERLLRRGTDRPVADGNPITARDSRVEERIGSAAGDAMASQMEYQSWRPTPVLARADLVRTFPEGYVIVLAPEGNRITPSELASLLGVQFVYLATAAEIDRIHAGRTALFQPYGSKYGIRTVMDVRLAGAEVILVTQGDPPQTLEIEMGDFGFREHPILGFISHVPD